MLKAIVLGVATLLAIPPLAADGDAPRLAGAWKLNRELSKLRPGAPDDGGAPRRPTGGTSPRGGVGGGGGMRGGGMRRGGAAMEDPEKRRQMRALLEELLEAPETLTITQDEGRVTFTHADGRVQHYRTDGRTEKHQSVNGTVETKTRWDAARLLIETDIGARGMKVVHAYSLAPDASSRQLIVEVTMEAGRLPRQPPPSRRVYDDVTATE